MMKPNLIALIIILFSTHSFAQEFMFLKQTKVSEMMTAEKANDPGAKFLTKNVFLTSDYYPLIAKHPVTLPIIVQRSITSHLPLYAEYYYTSSDSMLRAISYDWERSEYDNFFDKQKIWKEESGKLDFYNNEFSRISANIIKQLGVPAIMDIRPKEEQNDGKKYLTREAKWETDTYTASLYMIFASSTYRVRLFLYWKN